MFGDLSSSTFSIQGHPECSTKKGLFNPPDGHAEFPPFKPKEWQDSRAFNQNGQQFHVHSPGIVHCAYLGSGRLFKRFSYWFLFQAQLLRCSSWYAEALYGKEARANRASESGRLWKNINTSPISVPGTMSFGWYILASSQGSFRGLPWSPYSDLGFYIPL